MVELTILEALSELKLIKQRINKQMQNILFVDFWKSEEGKAKELICTDTKAKFQSIQDLIKRRSVIKAKIMQSNATTEVSIGGVKYTVAEAIAMKDMIRDHKELLEKMKTQRAKALEYLEDYNRDRQRKIDNILDRNFSKDSGKANAEDIRTITEMYQKKYYIEMIDPLNLAAEIEKLDEFISTFENSVDTKLSHSNAVTTITVGDN
jgi:hypothetical protein